MSGQDDPNTALGRSANDASRIITIGEEKHQKTLVSGLEGGLDDPSGRDKAARLIQVR
jgi:hypothetical protein